MKPHVKIYLKALGYDLGQPNQYRTSELSNTRAKDIHHIISRGRGGEDRIENLMGLNRHEHLTYGDKNIYMPTLLLAHRDFLKANGVKYDNNWFEEKLLEYSGKS